MPRTRRRPKTSPNEVDPSKVTKPVVTQIHQNLINAWKISKGNQMCYLFDLVVPVRQWKRGTVYTEEEPWAEYGPAPWGDLTETDEENKLQPYYPIEHERRYHFDCEVPLEKFLNWNDGELSTIRVGKTVTAHNNRTNSTDWKGISIPDLYVQLINQLLAEDAHGDTNESHEALRRQSYTRRVLDKVGKELYQASALGKDFRSAVLNPILQRYLRGVPDCYAPSIRSAISRGEPSISEVTQFYLGEDPVDPANIPHYRKSLLYIPEMRWFLGIVMGVIDLGSMEGFQRVRDNHDKVMQALADEDDDEDDEDDEDDAVIPALSQVEVEVVIDEGLKEFFKEELAQAGANEDQGNEETEESHRKEGEHSEPGDKGSPEGEEEPATERNHDAAGTQRTKKRPFPEGSLIRGQRPHTSSPPSSRRVRRRAASEGGNL